MGDRHDLWGDRGRPRPRQVAFDFVVAGAFTLLALAVAIQQGVSVVLVSLALGLAVALRRISWPAMAALAAGAGIAQLVLGELAILADTGYAAVFFVLGAHPHHAVRRFGLAAAVAAVAALAVAVGIDGIDAVGGVSTTFAVIGSAALAALVAGGGWAAGFVRWQSRARISAQVQADLQGERARIATDMHDLVAHTWAVVAAQADGARYSLGGPDSDRRTADALDVIAETARGSISDLGDLLARLRYEEPPTPSTPSGPSSRDGVEARMRASGMDLRLTSTGERWGPGVHAGAPHGLLAESLTNALKHGDLGHPVDAEEDWRHGYRLVVRNRIGTSPGPGTGHGLTGMRDRVTSAGGTFAAGADGDCWQVVATLPEPAP